MIDLVICLAFIIVCVGLRIAPILRVRQDCDAFYFLLTAEVFRRQRRIPVRLPNYYLAETREQTYPPGFTVFLSLFPDRWLRKYYWILNPLLDAANLAILYLFVRYNFGLTAALLAGLLYLVVPDLETECAALSSRGLGNLLLSGYMVGLLQFLSGGSVWWLLLTLFVGSLLVMTHKLTTQFLLVLSTGLSIFTLQVWPLTLFLSTIALTLLLFRKAYFMVLKGHYDVVTFWHKHFKERGGHLIYDSPLYAHLDKATKGVKLSQQPWWLLTRHAISCNPLLLGLPFTFSAAAAAKLTWALWLWGALCLLTVFATLFVPVLRQFGQGHRYAKMAAFPLATLTAVLLLAPSSIIVKLSLLMIALLCALKTLHNAYGLYQSIRRSPSAVDEDLLKIFDYINRENLDYIFCINLQPSEPIVYYCRKHVLWGGHHYGHNTMLVDFYPTLKKPFNYLMKTYGIRYLLLNEQYVSASDLGLSVEELIFRGGRYEIYDLKKSVKDLAEEPGVPVFGEI